MLPVLQFTRGPETPEEEVVFAGWNAGWVAFWEGLAKASQPGRRAGVGTWAAVEALVHYAHYHGPLKDTPEFLDALYDYAQANELPNSTYLDRRSLGSLLTIAVAALKVPDRQPG
jgi:hypothetical protein